MVALAMARFEVLILVDPVLIRQADQLVDAVGQYHPGVRIWRFDRGRRPALRTWADAAPDASAEPTPAESPPPTQSDHAGEHAQTAAPASAAAPTDQPSTDDQPAPADEQSSAPSDQTAHATADEPDHDTLEPPLLTDEELAMLLGDDETDSAGPFRQGES